MTPVPTPAPTPTRTETQRVSTGKRVLVVVDNTCTTPDFCASLRGFSAEQPTEALVIAPAHGGALADWYVDEDAARAEAMHRLRTCLRCLAHDGIRVRGQLGDPDPVQAIADALYAFDADEILLVTAPAERSGWLRPRVAERVQRRFAHPVHLVAMPKEAHR